jgi:hypothetical protein
MSSRLSLIALVLVLVAGCGAQVQGDPTAADAAGMPADFAGEVTYANGSVPPPYHYEWRVEFDDSTARLTWSPGYEGDQKEEWTEEVDLGKDDRAAYYDRIEKTGLFEFDTSDDGFVGGPTGRARFGDLHDSGTLGTSEEGKDMLEAVVAATEELFPAEVWSGMEGKQKAWEDSHPR